MTNKQNASRLAAMTRKGKSMVAAGATPEAIAETLNCMLARYWGAHRNAPAQALVRALPSYWARPVHLRAGGSAAWGR